MAGKPRSKIRCGARRKRDGQPCQAPALANGRCKFHGGMSTGPKTPEGKARCAEGFRRAMEARRAARVEAEAAGLPEPVYRKSPAKPRRKPVPKSVKIPPAVVELVAKVDAVHRLLADVRKPGEEGALARLEYFKVLDRIRKERREKAPPPKSVADVLGEAVARKETALKRDHQKRLFRYRSG